MGATASQDGNLAQLSEVNKEKQPSKRTSPVPETVFLTPSFNLF